jgi:single-stranded DNA-binding protein
MYGTSEVVLLGTVAEIEKLSTKSGKPWAKVLLEINRYRQTGADTGQDECTLVPIQLFSKIADIAGEHLNVGDAVAITCRISGTEYNDRQTGKIKRGVTLTADILHLIPKDGRLL